MEREITIKQLIKAIKRLPEDERRIRPGVWYQSQKEHWLGWLRDYDGPGAYGRKTGVRRDAKFAYNHIVCPDMLLYLTCAIPLPPKVVSAVEQAYHLNAPLMTRSGMIRKVAPWSLIEQALWGEEQASPLTTVLIQYKEKRL